MRISFAIILSLLIYSNSWGQIVSQQPDPMAVYGSVYIDATGIMYSAGTMHLKAPANDSIAKLYVDATGTILTMDTVIFYTNDSIEGLLWNRNTATGAVSAAKAVVRKKFMHNNHWYTLALPFEVDPANGVVNATTRATMTRNNHFEVLYYDTLERRNIGKHDETVWAKIPLDGTMQRGLAHRVAVKILTPADSIVDFISNGALTPLFEYQNKGVTLAFSQRPYYDNPPNSEGWNAIGGLSTTDHLITDVTVQFGTLTKSVYYRNETEQLWIAHLPSASPLVLRPYGVMYVQTDASVTNTFNGTSGGFTFLPSGLTFSRPPGGPVVRSLQRTDYDMIELQLANPANTDFVSPVYFRLGDRFSKLFVKAEDDIQLDTRHDRLPILWSLAQYENSAESNELFVNSMPYGENEVPLGVNAPLESEYVLSLREFTNETIQSVILWDKATGSKTELLKSSYSFLSGGNLNTQNRFVLFINGNGSNRLNEPAAEVYAYVENNRLTVKNLVPGDKIQVTNISGHTIIAAVADGNTFTTGLSQKGVYVVIVKGKTFKIIN